MSICLCYSNRINLMLNCLSNSILIIMNSALIRLYIKVKLTQMLRYINVNSTNANWFWCNTWCLLRHSRIRSISEKEINMNFTSLKLSLSRYWSFLEKTSLMQDPNPKWVQNFRWDVPSPVRGIWWSSPVLHKVILTCWGMQLRMQWTIRCIPH